MGKGLEHLPDFDLTTGGMYQVQLGTAEATVEQMI